MRTWFTFGAFGDRVVELDLWDLLVLLRGRELQVGGSVVICLGRSKLKPLGAAASREEQLRLQDEWRRKCER